MGVICISNLLAADNFLDVKDSIKKIKEELDDHLVAINENTDEIEMNYSYLIDLSQRVNVLEKKIDSIHSMLAKLTNTRVECKTQKIRIDENEQSVFMFLYESSKAVDYTEICERLRKSEAFVRYCMTRLIEKGVPIKKHTINRKIYFILDPEFKELQTKNGIVNIQKTLTLDCFDQKVLSH